VSLNTYDKHFIDTHEYYAIDHCYLRQIKHHKLATRVLHMVDDVAVVFIVIYTRVHALGGPILILERMYWAQFSFIQGLILGPMLMRENRFTYTILGLKLSMN
jgi:hypothetical protein